MALWCVVLPPLPNARRARPRWLSSEGHFSHDPGQAWTVADPQTAVARLPRWIANRDWDPDLLQRLRLVPFPLR
jgi:hypothetical protein